MRVFKVENIRVHGDSQLTLLLNNCVWQSRHILEIFLISNTDFYQDYKIIYTEDDCTDDGD